jgi:hypothetical protein
MRFTIICALLPAHLLAVGQGGGAAGPVPGRAAGRRSYGGGPSCRATGRWFRQVASSSHTTWLICWLAGLGDWEGECAAARFCLLAQLQLVAQFVRTGKPWGLALKKHE